MRNAVHRRAHRRLGTLVAGPLFGLLTACATAPALVDVLPRCDDRVRAPLELELERALQIDGVDDLEPSGLMLRRVNGRDQLLAVSDKHDHEIFELHLQPAAVVARPIVRFTPPAGVALDGEGIVGTPDGGFLLASEAQYRILKVTPAGEAEWHTPPLLELGRRAGLFQRRNAGIEGVTIWSGELVLAAEREPRGLIELKEGNSQEATTNVPGPNAYAVPDALCPAPLGRPNDFADLSVAGGHLFALVRNAHLVVRLEKVGDRFHEAEVWSYARTENDPAFAYRDRTFGLGEGLAVDDTHVYVVLDNNGQGRVRDRDDRRPLLFVFRRPRAGGS